MVLKSVVMMLVFCRNYLKFLNNQCVLKEKEKRDELHLIFLLSDFL